MGFLLFVLSLIGILCPLLLANTIITETVNIKSGAAFGKNETPAGLAKFKLLLIFLTALSWSIFIAITL